MISWILKLSLFLTAKLNFAYGFGILDEICCYVEILSEFIYYVDFANIGNVH